ncbi:hypothetical protein FACS189452_02100 [Bacteroidia bacterium]|nr:hypothetical protein FACS189452_02100 [Bacteroidia bacterium]
MKEFEIRDFFYDALSSYGLKYGKKELSVEGLRIDIFAIDNKHIPYIIEFKKDKNRHIVGQAAQYLALVPTYKEQIEKKLNFYDIKWEYLKIICIAPDFAERDFTAAEYDPLKGRIHFYNYKIIENSRKQISSLNVNYVGPEKTGPLVLPEKMIDEFDIKDIAEEYYKTEKKEARREYYSIKILPLLKDICNGVKDEFEKNGLYPHISDWDKQFTIRYGTDKVKSHRASIAIGFSDHIWYGFDLTHSQEEGKLLSLYLKDQDKRNFFIKNTLKLTDYLLWIPNTGINCYIPISDLNKKGLDLLLTAYTPEKHSDCYLRIIKEYGNNSLKKEDAIKILKDEYIKFSYIFDLMKN